MKLLKRTLINIVLLVSFAVPAVAGEVNKVLQAKLPTAIQKSGVLRVAISLAYPPMEYTEDGSKEVKGLDIDLAKEVASRLGLKADFQNFEFEQLMPAIATGRADVIWTAFSDLKERQSQLDFVDYFKTGDQIFGLVENKSSIKEFKDLCGKTMTISSGTSWVEAMQALSKQQCGNKPVTILQIPTQGEQILQMRQGRAKAAVIGYEGLADLDRHEPGKFYAVGGLLNPNYYGVGISKKNNGLRDAVFGALESMLLDGTYHKILKSYGLSGGAVKVITKNVGS